MRKMITFLLLALVLPFGASAHAALIDNGNGTVTDSRTGLIWQQGEPGTMAWGSAPSYCEGLDLGGSTSWRLPNYKELESLTDDTRWNPAIDTTKFPNAHASDYWSSTSYADGPDGAWSVAFDDGGVDAGSKGTGFYVRCVRGGQSGSFGNLVISPSDVDFGVVDPGAQSIPQTFTVTNTGTTDLTVTATTKTGTQSLDFGVGNNLCAGATLPPSGTCTLEAVFAPLSFGAKAATLTVKSGTAASAIALLKGAGGAAGNSDVFGTVTDQNYQPLSGATVKIGGNTAATAADGGYSLTNVTPGTLYATVTKPGYAGHSGSVSIPPYSSAVKNFVLQQVTPGAITITGLTTKYDGFVYFLAGTSFNVTFTANVFWGGHPPGTVRFTTSRGTYDVPTTGTKASRAFNVGLEFDPCETLTAVAISTDGTQSAAAVADFVMMSPILGGLAFQALDIGDGFFYETKQGFNLKLIDDGIRDGVIPEDIPLFGNKGFNLRYVPALDARIESNGTVDIGLDWENKALASGQLGLVDYNLGYLSIDIAGTYQHPGCDYDWSGSIGLQGDVSVSRSWPFIFMAGPIPIPMYGKASIQLSVDAGLAIEDISPAKLNGIADIDPYVRGSLGAGADKIFTIEGWLGGGAEMQLQYPQKPTVKDATLYLDGGVTIYAKLWEWPNKVLRWDWTIAGAAYQANPGNDAPVQPHLISRDYLARPGYGTFNRTLSFRPAGPAKAGGFKVEAAPLQLAIFPQPEANLSSNGMKLSLAYLTDNPLRTDINRTMAVFTRSEGTTWSEPQAIAEDGTADFHPETITFGDGSVIAAWENGKIALPETATFEESVKNLEIAAAVFDPATQTWSAPRALTNNAWLDVAPKLAGRARTNTMLVWAANPDNDLSGGAAHPNRLWYAKFNGAVWSAPKLIAEVPYGLLKYSLAYTGTKAQLVLSLDMDGDRGTVADHELFLLTFEGGVWGALTRLTDDTLPDDNPELTLDPAGKFLLVWLKEKELSSVLEFDFNNRTIVRSDEYSTNLADFKLATSSDGKISLVWAEPAQYGSDLMAIFYDPLLKLWGGAAALTADPETERGITAAYSGKNMLMAVYNRNQVGTRPLTRTAADGRLITIDAPVPLGSDLYLLRHRLEKDLALAPGSLGVAPANAGPGQTATFTVTGQNLGDTPAESVVVAFYSGNPGAGGVEIGRETIAAPLKPGDAAEVAFVWTVPATTVPLAIFAVIDPAAQIDTQNRSDNSASLVIARPDLTFENVRSEKLTQTLFSIQARVTNNGTLAAGATTVTYRMNGASGQLLRTENITALDANQSRDVSFTWDVLAIPQDTYTLVMTVDEGQAIDEYDEANNTETVTIEGWSPADLSAVAISTSRIVLAWADRASDEDGYTIQRKGGDCASANPWAQIAGKGADVVTHTDVNLAAGSTYSYRVQAYSAVGTSAFSGCASATTGLAGTPAAPTGLTATAGFAGTVNLNWTDALADEIRFEIERRTDAGAFAVIGQTAQNIKAYTDATATGNSATTGYQYRVKACNAAGCSPATSVAVVPFKPTVQTATAISAARVDVTWRDKSGDETGFVVQRKSGSCTSAEAWATVQTTVPNVSRIVDTAVSAATTYSYRIRATAQTRTQPYATGNSLFTPCVSVTTP